MKTRTRAQSWTSDFLIGFLIFIIAILLSVKLITNLFTQGTFADVEADTIRVSNTLMDTGYPVNWSFSIPQRIGLLTGDKLSLAKYNTIQQGVFMKYENVKNLLNTPYDFYFNFENVSGIMNLTGYCGYGYGGITTGENCTMNLTTVSYNNLIKVSRFIVIGTQVVRMNVYLFDTGAVRNYSVSPCQNKFDNDGRKFIIRSGLNSLLAIDREGRTIIKGNITQVAAINLSGVPGNHFVMNDSAGTPTIAVTHDGDVLFTGNFTIQTTILSTADHELIIYNNESKIIALFNPQRGTITVANCVDWGG